jgi:hypothetical protein
MLCLDNLNPEIVCEEICTYLKDGDLFSLSCINHTWEQSLEPVFKKRYDLFENPEDIYTKDAIEYAKFLPETIQTLHTVAKHDAVNLFKYLYILNTKYIYDYLFCACEYGSYKIVSCILDQYEFSCDAISSILEKCLALPLDNKVEKVIQTIIKSKQAYDIDINKYEKSVCKLGLNICKELIANNKSSSSNDVSITSCAIRNNIIRYFFDKGTFPISGISAVNLLYTYMPNQTITPLTMLDICSVLFLVLLHSGINNNLYLIMVIGGYLYAHDFITCFSPEISLKLVFYSKSLFKHIITIIAAMTCLLSLQLSRTYFPLLVSLYSFLSNTVVVVVFTSIINILLKVNINTFNLTRLSTSRIHPYIYSLSMLCYKMNKYLYPSMMISTYYIPFCFTTYGQAIVYTLVSYKMSFRLKCGFVVLSSIILAILPSHLVIIGYVCLSELYLKTTKLSTLDILLFIIITLSYHIDVNIALLLTASRILFDNTLQKLLFHGTLSKTDTKDINLIEPIPAN